MPARGDEVSFWEELWNAMLKRLQVPVEGVLLSRETARRIGEPVLQRLVRQHREAADEPAVSAEGLGEAATTSKEYVADERKLAADQQLHRNPDDRRYEKNLDLPALQERKADGRFGHLEWTALDGFLRPFGFQVIRRKGLNNEDGEEVFNETFASMAVARDGREAAPIEELIVFEEIIPNFCRRIGFRAIDHVRRRTSQKARPEELHSLEGAAGDAPMQVADRSVADRERPDTWRFEDIYAQCREELSPAEWGLVFDLYVAQNYTVKDLVADREKLEFLGIDSGQSASTLRRRVEDIVQPALGRLADALSV